eukprot:TRINITY_DN28141_c0_g1_i1.p1 TRINITY_DN28141_c0_g1~~TRINITY_DN28141_c0_g1_i1.p1  ORF type:complete len:367 (-),score=74.19 TRINITY_DN28141_c0_g1_i1:109-1209(-)
MGGETSKDAAQPASSPQDTSPHEDTSDVDGIKPIKVLLLGIGESGKATLWKHLAMIYGDPPSEDKRKNCLTAIHLNIIAMTCKVLSWYTAPQDGGDNKEEDIMQISSLEIGERVKEVNKSMYHSAVAFRISADVGKDLETLWADPVFNKLLRMGDPSKMFTPFNLQYFCDKIAEIIDPNYLPSDQDILNVRVRTSGLEARDLEIKGKRFRAILTGGQRNERRKWIHALSDFSAVIYVFSVADYDKVLLEDATRSYVEESLQVLADLFDQSPSVRTVPFVVAMNMQDILEKKSSAEVFKSYFPEFDGETVEDVNQFYQKLILTRIGASAQKDMIHFVPTIANNTEQMRSSCDKIFDLIAQHIPQANT